MREFHVSGRLEGGNKIKVTSEPVNRLVPWRQSMVPQLPAWQETPLLTLSLFPLQPMTSQKIGGETL